VTANPEPPGNRSRNLLPAGLIVLATVVAYWPTLFGDFIWNDSDYVTAPKLRPLSGLSRIWTQLGATEQYYPLLHSAFWVQHRLWGDHPIGYHIVTILLHAGCAILFACVLRRLLGDGPRFAGAEWLAALVFALHPVHVESVAWITEQKNTLSLAFYLASVLAYLRFDAKRSVGAYLGGFALFVLSMECKTVTATLPAALLVVFWWKRGRIDLKRDALPLVPWLVLGGAWGMFSSWVERVYGDAQGADFRITALGRVLVAGRAVCFYLGKLVWPFGLNFIYPKWQVDPGNAWQWLFPLAAVGLGIGLWMIRHRTRAPLAGYLFFVGSLFPVLGFVNLYGARYSWVWDHWQYLPDLGPIALASGAAALLWNRRPRPPRLGLLLAGALAIPLGSLCWAHGLMFHDDETLYLETLARNPDCWMAHYNLGVLWSDRPDKRGEVIAHYEAAIRLKPDHVKARYNLAVALERVPGRTAEAMQQYEEVIRLQPDNAEAHTNLGGILLRMPGRLGDAIGQYREAIELEPGNAAEHLDLGDAWMKVPGRLEEAIAQFREAIRLQPGLPAAHFNLAIALAQEPGGIGEAKAELEEVVRLQPDNELARRFLARARELAP
jgi:tetratricopeptide (TPR) repeat protein